MGADLLRGPRFGRHVRDAEVDELPHALVGKGAAVVAPLAVVLVEGTVRLTAQGAVVERQAAALADELTRGAKQGIDGHVEKAGQQFFGGKTARVLPRVYSGRMAGAASVLAFFQGLCQFRAFQNVVVVIAAEGHGRQEVFSEGDRYGQRD